MSTAHVDRVLAALQTLGTSSKAGASEGDRGRAPQVEDLAFARLLSDTRREQVTQAPPSSGLRHRLYGIATDAPARSVFTSLARIVYDSWSTQPTGLATARGAGSERLLRLANDAVAIDIALTPRGDDIEIRAAVEGAATGTTLRVFRLDDETPLAETPLDSRDTAVLTLRRPPTPVALALLDADGEVLRSPALPTAQDDTPDAPSA